MAKKLKKWLYNVAIAGLSLSIPVFAQFVSFQNNIILNSTSKANNAYIQEFIVDGYEHERVMNLFSNPSEFNSTFRDYDGSKFNIGFVCLTYQLPLLTKSQCAAYFKVDGDNIRYITTMDRNGYKAVSDSPTDLTLLPEIDLTTGTGFEYFQTDIESGITRNNWSASKLVRTGPYPLDSNYPSMEYYSIGSIVELYKDANGNVIRGNNRDGLEFYNNGSYNKIVSNLANYEPFTIKIGILSTISVQIWFNAIRWNDSNKIPAEDENDYGYAQVGNTTKWKEELNSDKREGVIFTLIKDPYTQEVGIYSGNSQINSPVLNPEIYDKINGLTPSEAVNKMFAGELPIFVQKANESFPGAIYGDSSYKITTNDKLGSIKIEYKPGSILRNGQVTNYDGNSFVFETTGFDITTIDNISDIQLEAGQQIDIYKKPSEISKSNIVSFLYDYNKYNPYIINPPNDLSIDDLDCTFIPIDSEYKIHITSITIKRIKVSINNSIIVKEKSITKDTDFVIYGFISLHEQGPADAPTNNLSSEIWLNGSKYNLIPQALAETLQNNNNQQLEFDIIESVKSSLRFKRELEWKNGISAISIVKDKVVSNAADGLSYKNPQITTKVLASNLYNNKTNSYEDKLFILYAFNCPYIKQTNLPKIPNKVTAANVSSVVASMTVNEVLKQNPEIFKSYLNNLYNKNLVNTKIPYAYVSNISLDRSKNDNSIIVSYDVSNFISENNYELINKTNQSIEITDFYVAPTFVVNQKSTYFDGNETVNVPTFIRYYPSDFANDSLATSRLLDYALTSNYIINNFKNLPSDYEQKKYDPIIFKSSIVANDQEQVVTFNYALSYAQLNNENVYAPEGTIITGKMKVTGFNRPQNFEGIQNSTITVDKNISNVNYEDEFRNFLATWLTNHKTNFPDNHFVAINNIITTTKIIVYPGNFNTQNNQIEVSVKVPELATLIKDENAQMWINGVNFIFQFDGKYQTNTIDIVNNGALNITYQDFIDKLNNKQIQYNELIVINNDLPIDTDITISVSDYDSNKQTAIVSFIFTKYYGPNGLLTNYVYNAEFNFYQQVDIVNYFVDVINYNQFQNPYDPFNNLSAAEIVYESINNTNYLQTINSYFNTNTIKELIIRDKQLLNQKIVIKNISLTSNSEIEVTLSFVDGVNEKIKITNLNEALPSSVNEKPLSTSITFDNIKNQFIGLSQSELNKKASEFITLNNLPTNSKITSVNVFNVGYDKNDNKVAYINFIVDKYFIDNNNLVQIANDYIIQIKITFANDYVLSKIISTSDSDYIKPITDSYNQRNNNLIGLILIITLSSLFISSLITLWLIRKRIKKDNHYA